MSNEKLPDEYFWCSTPFKMKCLDCRPLSLKVVLGTREKEVAETYTRLSHSKDCSHIGKSPHNSTDASCNLRYPCAKIDEGGIYRSPEMEFKWNIDFYGGSLYFSNSWTGDLVYKARCNFKDNQLIIDQVEAKEGKYEKDFAPKAVDHIIKSHLLHLIAPHPISNKIDIENTKEMALDSFRLFGRTAWFGTREDNSSLSISDLAPLQKSLLVDAQSKFPPPSLYVEGL